METVRAVVFQSTRPVRGETDVPGQIRRAVEISIHSPRAGRDRERVPGDHGGRKYFNPLAPCGARRAVSHSLSIAKAFQSTRPVRGETRGYEEAGFDRC